MSFVALFVLALVAELIDSTVGMGFGTLLGPTLTIGFGYLPAFVVPILLISQTASGLLAGLSHQELRNFEWRAERATLSFLIPSAMAGAVLGSMSTLFISVWLQTLYVGTTLVILGTLTFSLRFVSPVTEKVPWFLLAFLGLWGAFNKAFFGGGFGPVVAGGQILAGRSAKAAIGVTTLTEAAACASGLATYLTITSLTINLEMLLPILLASVVAGVLGALLIWYLPERAIRSVTGAGMATIGCLVIFKGLLGF
jgi:uncharacterized membrane protein YfcA